MNNELDIYLFHRGEHRRAYEYLGAHIVENGVVFRVWAPNARSVRVVGNFNYWNVDANYMNKINNEGIWELFIEGLKRWEVYKFAVEDRHGSIIQKADPYARYSEYRPKTGSVIYGDSEFNWTDNSWIEKKNSINHYEEPLNIYEVHLSSWQKRDDDGFLNYKVLGDRLAEYAEYMGYTHIELMPISEYPLDDSWGYQGTGYYSVTCRYGRPEELKYLINKLHERGIGVILDWVPGHFCKDEHGLNLFDGTPTYEYSFELLRENYDWGTANFDLGRNEVKSFLISNALYWMREFHIDGLRVDAVANMLYLDYGKSGHPLLKNEYGGNQNYIAVEFFRQLNRSIFEEFPNNYMFAEESTSWPQITQPDYVGGLGFNYKWNMGWMNDTLEYMEKESYYRKWQHNNLVFSFVYIFSENYTLPLSHDEVVHGKKSLIEKMPGHYDEKFSNLRALYGYMMATPGKKLLFMGGELGQFKEWNFKKPLDWNLLDYPKHRQLHNYVRDLNHFYKSEKALWNNSDPSTFRWIDSHSNEESVISFIRQGKDPDEIIIIVLNFTPVRRWGYKVGVPRFIDYEEVFNSDLVEYGGESTRRPGDIEPKVGGWKGMNQHIVVDIPPLSAVYFKGKV